MSRVNQFSTSNNCRNGYEIEVVDGSVSWVRRFWSDGANQREYSEKPKEGTFKLTPQIIRTSMKEIILERNKDDVKELFLSLNKNGRDMMEEARAELITEIEELF